MTSVSRCHACGAFVEEGDQFCGSCGTAIGAPAESPQVKPVDGTTESDPEIDLSIRRAHLAQQRGELDESERLLRAVLAGGPQNVSALSLLSEVLRAKGDLVGAVAAAQRATDADAGSDATSRAAERAREERAQIEASVVREVGGPTVEGPTALFGALAPREGKWYGSTRFYAVLIGLGLASLFLALVVLLRGELLGYVWFAVSFLAAGWCYHDAESRRLGGLFWGTFVLFLGPFGLAIYLLTRY